MNSYKFEIWWDDDSSPERYNIKAESKDHAWTEACHRLFKAGWADSQSCQYIEPVNFTIGLIENDCVRILPARCLPVHRHLLCCYPRLYQGQGHQHPQPTRQVFEDPKMTNLGQAILDYIRDHDDLYQAALTAIREDQFLEWLEYEITEYDILDDLSSDGK